MSETFPRSAKFSMEDMIEYSEGSVVSRQVLKNDAGNLTLFSFEKGRGLIEHTAPFDALVQILEGRAEIRIGGESVIMPAGIKHSLHAQTRFKMLLTMIRA
jgi:Uncharacterized conserved protein, contains double-stranded beta-helix domain